MSWMVCVRCQAGDCPECLDPACQCQRPMHVLTQVPTDIWQATQYGVKWGPMEITRLALMDRGPKNGGVWRVLGISAGVSHPDKDVTISVSSTGKSLYVHRLGRILK